MPFNADNTNNQNDKIKDQEQNNGPINLSGSGSGQTNASSNNNDRIANYSSGQPSSSTGSGRFTNLQKYIGANQGAGEHLGEKINDTYNKSYEKDTNNINDQNGKIADQINQGKQVLNEGQGFNNQLSNIGTSLGTFQSMNNRGQFDQGTQQAQQFAQSPNFNRFQTIQSGNAIDNNALNTAQNNALTSGQALKTNSADMLNKISNEQGRNDLLRSNFGLNKNYSAGSSRLDNLFLQGSPNNIVGNLTNQFNQKDINANNILNNVNTQGTNVTDLLNNEGTLVNNLNTQAQKNQDIFNTKLGDQSNIDYINKLRNDKYNEYLNQLKTGNAGTGLTDLLGLNNVNTYQANQLINPITNGQKFNADGTPVGTPVANPRALTAYNADLADTAGSYLGQGRQAMNMQDITSDQDYAAYQALQNIANRDTGKLAGASQIDAAVQAKRNLDGQSLTDVLSGMDQAYRNNYAGRDFQTNTYATQSGPGGGFMTGGYSDGKGGTIGRNGAVVNDTTIGTPMDFGTYYNDMATAMQGGRGSGAVGQSTANIDDYLKNGQLNSTAAKLFDRGGDTESNRAAQADALARAQAGTKNALENIIGQTGVRNTLNINQDDSANPVLQAAKRFSRLV